MKDIVIRNALVYTGVEGAEDIPNGTVCVRDGMISYVGLSAGAPHAPGAEVIDAKCGMLMPALYNAHTHSAMTALRGVGSDLNLQDWLFREIFPREDRLTAEIADAAGRLAILEMIASGTVGFCDMYMFADTLARASIEAGVRAIICRAQVGNTMEELRPRLDEGTAVFREFDGEGHVQVYLGPHAEYTTSPETMRAVAQAARDLGTGIHVHASETRSEHEECVKRHGKTPVAVFDEAGLFSAPRGAVVAHAVWAEENDMDILAVRGARVAHCPVSNLKLACGVMPLARMLGKGVRIALGTDSVASNNSLDLFEEIKMAAILHKGWVLDPTVIPARTAVWLATRDAARACGFERCGSIERGNQADLILLDADRPGALPVRDAAGHIAYSARGADVRMTMCAGKVLYRDGEFMTLDAEKIKADFSRLYAKVEG